MKTRTFAWIHTKENFLNQCTYLEISLTKYRSTLIAHNYFLYQPLPAILTPSCRLDPPLLVWIEKPCAKLREKLLFAIFQWFYLVNKAFQQLCFGLTKKTVIFRKNCDRILANFSTLCCCTGPSRLIFPFFKSLL